MKIQDMRILIRTAGGKEKNQQLGMGHIYRTMNLGKEFGKNNVYFLIEDFGGAKKILDENGFEKIKIIKRKSSMSDDYNFTKKIAIENEINVIVIDRFNVNFNYVKNISKSFTTVVITDLNNIKYESKLLVNGFVGFKNKMIINQFKTKCLIGPQFQILHKNFQKKSKNKNKMKKTRILITFGGIDEKNILEKILESLIQFMEKIEFRIIIGPLAKKSKKLTELSKKFPNSIKIKNHVKNMHKEITEVDFGICGGGLTTYEFASVGTPFAIICDDRHQIITAKEWEKQKIAINLGMISDKTPQKTTKVIRGVLNNEIKLKKGTKLVDGNGSKRVMNEILKIQ
jgi:spore coat polysaccharide biosynthesis predicted glycosyltransferase SpsG